MPETESSIVPGLSRFVSRGKRNTWARLARALPFHKLPSHKCVEWHTADSVVYTQPANRRWWPCAMCTCYNQASEIATLSLHGF
jgi:hypothetical protein